MLQNEPVMRMLRTEAGEREYELLSIRFPPFEKDLQDGVKPKSFTQKSL